MSILKHNKNRNKMCVGKGNSLKQIGEKAQEPCLCRCSKNTFDSSFRQVQFE